MRTTIATPYLLCLAMLLTAVPPALGASKHFRVSHEHFNDYAAKAADLYFRSGSSAGKNILSHLTAISAIYAEKAFVVMNLTDILEHMVSKRDKRYVSDRLADVKRAILSGLPQDVKLLADLVENQDNQEIRDLGNLVVNEMRVFERNTENL